MEFRITMRNIEEVSAELRALARRAGDLKPVLAQFGIHMLRSIQKTFAAGGRPAWKTSMRARTTGGKTLIRSARLKNSMVAQVTGPNTLSVGTNVAYAAVHQFGFDGTVQVPQHIRRVKSRDQYGRAVVTSASGVGIRMKKQRTATGFAVVRAHPHHMRIPARPFLVVQDEDMEIFKRMVIDRILDEK